MSLSDENSQKIISFFNKIIGQDKKYLFGFIGFLSGFLGALIADITVRSDTNFIFQILIVALWAGVFTTVISLGLHWASDVYSRRKTDLKVLFMKAVPMGFIAGAVSGGCAQAIFSLNLYHIPWIDFVFRAICWGICGCLLGACLSYNIPNLGIRRAVIAGFAGGLIGGAGFQIMALLLPATLGRMFGVGILGLALGLCIVFVEERSRSAYLEVHWAPNEISKFTLGNIPIYIGGGEDDVYISGIQHHAMSLVSEKGNVSVIHYVTGKKTDLNDGSRINVDKVEMFVRIVQK